MLNPLRIALAGSGGVARRYRGTYRHLPGVQVVATIDVNETEAQQAAVELGAARASTKFADALRDDVDAVVISTRPTTFMPSTPSPRSKRERTSCCRSPWRGRPLNAMRSSPRSVAPGARSGSI